MTGPLHDESRQERERTKAKRLYKTALLAGLVLFSPLAFGQAERLDLYASRLDSAGGLSTITCTAPLSCAVATPMVFSVSITPTNPGGAVALQASSPGTSQTGNATLSGTVKAATLQAGWNRWTGASPGTMQAGTATAYDSVAAGNLTATALATPVITSVTPTLSKVGSITTVAFADLLDTDYFTLSDGASYVFEFDVAGNGVTGGRISVPVVAGDTADNVRDKVITAINLTAIQMTATSGGAATVTLQMDTAGLPGGSNTENVTNGTFAVAGMADPTAATTYGYKVAAYLSDGLGTAASAEVTTAAGTATLSAANYNHVVWGAVTGTTTYDVYRTTGGAAPPKYLGSVTAPAVSYDDVGATGTGSTPPTTNRTGIITTTGRVNLTGSFVYSSTSNRTKFTESTGAGPGDIEFRNAYHGDGSVSEPTFRFVNQDGVGFYRAESNTISVTTNSTLTYKLGPTAFSSIVPLLVGTVITTPTIEVNQNGVFRSNTKSLADATPTAFADVAMADGDMVSGEIIYTVTATEGTDKQARGGRWRYSAVRKGATVTVGSGSEVGTQDVAVSGGTLTGAISCAAGTAKFTCSANFDSSLTTPTVVLEYRFETPSANLVTPL